MLLIVWIFLYNTLILYRERKIGSSIVVNILQIWMWHKLCHSTVECTCTMEVTTIKRCCKIGLCSVILLIHFWTQTDLLATDAGSSNSSMTTHPPTCWPLFYLLHSWTWWNCWLIYFVPTCFSGCIVIWLASALSEINFQSLHKKIWCLISYTCMAMFL
jgi:hypothetical protein